LREALVAPACRLIAEHGLAGFTLVEETRSAGVSFTAPYRHFEDRDALLAEVAGRGFAEFATRLTEAWQRKQDRAAILRVEEAYFEFAHSEPGYYAAMFAPRPVRARARHVRQAVAALEHGAPLTQVGAHMQLLLERVSLGLNRGGFPTVCQ
jgi:AcrR family transcriptional regulator